MDWSKGRLEIPQKESVVTNFARSLEKIFNSGDPEVRKFFLVRQTYLPFLLCGLYVLFAWKVGPALMRNRKPFGLRKIMVVVSFTNVFMYLTAISTYFWYIRKITWQEFCIKAEVTKGEPTYMLARIFHIIYLLKYTAFSDTVFFVLRKKNNQITFLHVTHHTVVVLIGWTLLRTETSGIQSIPVILNCIVHVVMYSYYGLSAMGPQVRKYLWWKKYLTQLQMIQFCLMTVFVTVIVPLSGCKMVTTTYFMAVFLPPFFFYLFYMFYKMAFQSETKTGGQCSVKKSN